MVYPIVKFPDPILQRPAEPVTAFDDDLRKLVDDMFESMYVAHGIGLAAPQIGIPKRITVIDLSFQKTPEDKIALINPEVVRREWMPVATMARDFGAANLAAVDVRKRNHDRTISRNRAPATTDYILSYNSVGYTH